jgi:Family of unknown function (DUF7002)
VVTEPEFGELLSDCPTLYHMAEDGSWPSIRERGLLSTSALLDLYALTGPARVRIEARRRNAGVALERTGLPRATVRDQLPMDDAGLRRCLPAHLGPEDWYRLLNQKVFFWLTRERLIKLLKAGAYRDRPHTVIEVCTRKLVAAHRQRIWFCPMNSGCTKPYPHPRDEQTFQRIPDYPYSYWRARRRRGERVVELAIDYSVPNITEFVTRVVRMQGSQELGTLAL